MGGGLDCLETMGGRIIRLPESSIGISSLLIFSGRYFIELSLRGRKLTNLEAAQRSVLILYYFMCATNCRPDCVLVDAIDGQRTVLVMRRNSHGKFWVMAVSH